MKLAAIIAVVSLFLVPIALLLNAWLAEKAKCLPRRELSHEQARRLAESGVALWRALCKEVENEETDKRDRARGGESNGPQPISTK